jgi:NitT/TauT family transport system substrate-binding protein
LAASRRCSLRSREPETKRLHLARIPSNCFAPQYVAEDVLRSEGFAELAYVQPMDCS